MRVFVSFIVAVSSFILFVCSASGSSLDDPFHGASQSMTAVDLSCAQQLKSFKEDNPPVDYLGDPSSERWPEPSLMAKKVGSALYLYRMLSHSSSARCQQMVKEACWEYCGAGIEHGSLELYCILHACTDD